MNRDHVTLLLAEPSGLLAANLVRTFPDGQQRLEDVFVRDLSGRPALAPIDVGGDGETVAVVIYASGLRGHNLRDVRAIVGGIPLPLENAERYSARIGLDALSFVLPRALAGQRSVEVVLRAGTETSNTGRLLIR